jgi:hypothetical protein
MAWRGGKVNGGNLLVNVTRSLEHIAQSHDSSVQFQHVLFDNKVLPPDFENVRLKSRSGRSIIEEPSATTVNLKRRSEKEPPGKQGIEQGLVEFVSRLVDDD